MSYLSENQQDWRSSTPHALLFASVIGPATALACFGFFFALRKRDVFLSDRQFALGYRIGLGVTVLIESIGVLIPMTAICAFGLVVFGLPVSNRFGYGLVARWTVIVALLWGAVSAGLMWTVVSAMFSNWQFESSDNFLIGCAFGAPTGFWWWFFYRRVLIRRAALAD